MSDNLFVPENALPSADALQAATLGAYVSGKGWTLVLDGQTAASAKNYKRLDGATLSAGDRVLVAKLSGTFVILGKITV